MEEEEEEEGFGMGGESDAGLLGVVAEGGVSWVGWVLTNGHLLSLASTTRAATTTPQTTHLHGDVRPGPCHPSPGDEEGGPARKGEVRCKYGSRANTTGCQARLKLGPEPVLVSRANTNHGDEDGGGGMGM